MLYKSLDKGFFFLYNSALALTFDLQTKLKATAQPLPKGILWTKYQIRKIVDLYYIRCKIDICSCVICDFKAMYHYNDRGCAVNLMENGL